MFNNLGDLLCTITGFDSFSLQPNAGAAGEYAGLMVIRAYHKVSDTNQLLILFTKRKGIPFISIMVELIMLMHTPDEYCSQEETITGTCVSYLFQHMGQIRPVLQCAE